MVMAPPGTGLPCRDMAVILTIPDVPDAVRDELAARAERSGRTLEDYVGRHLAALAARPDFPDVPGSGRVRGSPTQVLDIAAIAAARDHKHR